MAELIEKELQKFDSPEKTEIFFSAHGVPVSYVEQVCMCSTHDALHALSMQMHAVVFAEKCLLGDCK